MKKRHFFILLIGGLLFSVPTFSSCKAKYGCTANEKLRVKTDKEGNLSTKKGKSNLFSKKQRKKMKSKS